MTRISDILIEWYAREGRDLPWRRTRDPYRIWLSEVILQQTRVAQGLAYYERFMSRYPDVASLAAASEDEVLKLWQGLGYYSRARNLLAAAREVVARFGGAFPRTLDDVRSLRGVGDYTAAAICSIAYDTPCAVVDGNVYRVLSRLFDLDLPIDSTPGRRAFAELALRELDPARPGLHNQAIMDFGAIQCTPVSPRCEACPLSERCLALASGTVAERPVKQGRTRVRDRWFHYLHITSGDRTLLRRREGRTSNVLTVGDLELDVGSHTVRRAGKIIDLPAREFAILEYMMMNEGVVLSRENIYEHTSDWNYEGNTAVITVYVSLIRRKIDDGFDRKLIHTVHGVGYMIRDGL